VAILFVGFAVPEELLRDVTKEDAAPQVAAHKLQWNIINGIHSQGQNISIISSVPISTFPKNPKIWVGSVKWSNDKGIEGKTVQFINLPLFKHLTRFVTCFVHSFFWAWVRRKEKKKVIIYAVHTPHVLALVAVSKIIKMDIYVMVPDLPMYMDIGFKRGFFRAIAKPIDAKLSIGLLQSVTGIIGITQTMLDDYFPEKLSMVVEGVVSSKAIIKSKHQLNRANTHKDEVIIMYAGGVSTAYGIQLLLEAFQHIKQSNYRLWICGKGELEDKCRAASLSDNRIKYFGFVDNAEVTSMMSKASILVNPRLNEGNYTKYSFPSKILEYLATGKPVVSLRLPGIPDDYCERLFIAQQENALGLAQTITTVGELSDLQLKEQGLKTLRFLESKTEESQGRRILDFISKAGSQC